MPARKSNQNADIAVSTAPLPGIGVGRMWSKAEIAIGRHDEQVVADGVEVADLAAVEELDSLEVRLGQRGWHRVRRERSDR